MNYVVTEPGLCHFPHGQKMCQRVYLFMQQVFGSDSFTAVPYNRKLQQQLRKNNRYTTPYSERALMRDAYEILEKFENV